MKRTLALLLTILLFSAGLTACAPSDPETGGDGTRVLADFSSYEGILRVWERMAQNHNDYRRSDFDEIAERDFLFPNEAARETFLALAESILRFAPYMGKSADDPINYAYHFGYAKKDLNGDGREELILMTALYELVAVFTVKKDGTPVLLRSFDYETDGAINAAGELLLEYADRIRDNYYRARCAIGSDGTLVVREMFGFDEELGYFLYDPTKAVKRPLSNEEYQSIVATLPFLTYHTGAEITATAAGLDFVRIAEVTEETRVKILAAYENAISGDGFVEESIDGASKRLGGIRFDSGKTFEKTEKVRSAVIDLEGDGVPERLLMNSAGDVILLYSLCGTVLYATYAAEEIGVPMADGTFRLTSVRGGATVLVKHQKLVHRSGEMPCLREVCSIACETELDPVRFTYSVDGRKTEKEKYEAVLATLSETECDTTVLRDGEEHPMPTTPEEFLKAALRSEIDVYSGMMNGRYGGIEPLSEMSIDGVPFGDLAEVGIGTADLDGDGIAEVLLRFPSDGSKLVLRYCDGIVHAIRFRIEDMDTVYENGAFTASLKGPVKEHASRLYGAMERPVFEGTYYGLFRVAKFSDFDERDHEFRSVWRVEHEYELGGERHGACYLGSEAVSREVLDAYTAYLESSGVLAPVTYETFTEEAIERLDPTLGGK